MNKYIIVFAYDGSNFSGYQKQLNKRTVQNEIEKSLFKILKHPAKLIASGRTDAKVHAYNQVAHFETDKDIEEDALLKGLKSLTPKDIYIKELKSTVESFHARFDVKRKTYVYKINLATYNPFDRNYIYQYNKKLSIKDIEKAIKLFKGEHNFKSFSKSDKRENYIRKIYNSEIKVSNNILEITFTGNGFLRYMIRNMVGTLIEVGEKKREPSDINKILKLEDRTEAGKTAPGEGLYLKEVIY